MKKIPKERLLGKQLGKEATEEGLSYYRWNADSGRFHNDEGKEETSILKANALNEQISKDKKLLRYGDDVKRGDTKKYEKSFQDMFEKVKKKKFNTDLETAKRKAYKILTTPEVKPKVQEVKTLVNPYVEMRNIQPTEDVETIIRRRANETLMKERKVYADKFGVEGIASLKVPK